MTAAAGEGTVIRPPLRCDYGYQTHVGARTLVGAGAVVTRDLPPNVVAVGNPARVIRTIES